MSDPPAADSCQSQSAGNANSSDQCASVELQLWMDRRHRPCAVDRRTVPTSTDSTHTDGRVAQCFGGALVMRVTGRAHRRRMGLLAVMGLPVLVGLASADQAHDVAADALVAGAAGGWLDSSPASEALEALLGDDACTIERRTVESLAEGEFQRDYFQKKAVLLRFESAASAIDTEVGSAGGFQQSWSAVEVKEWLAEQGMAELSSEAFGEQVDGMMAVEMDASDWATLGASAEQVAQLSRDVAPARAPIWSREGLKQHCGAWDASIPTVRAIIASDGGDVKFQPLSEYLDYLRDSELKGVRHCLAASAIGSCP